MTSDISSAAKYCGVRSFSVIPNEIWTDFTTNADGQSSQMDNYFTHPEEIATKSTQLNESVENIEPTCDFLEESSRSEVLVQPLKCHEEAIPTNSQRSKQSDDEKVMCISLIEGETDSDIGIIDASVRKAQKRSKTFVAKTI